MKSALFEGDSGAGSLLSRDGHTLYLNENTGNLTGGTRLCDIHWFAEQYELCDEHFTRTIPLEEFPITAAHRTHNDVSERVYGFVTDEGRRLHLAIHGKALFDPLTGDYIGALSWARLLGTYETILAAEQAASLKSFKTISDHIPHFVWTADREGSRDWFSKQWCDYTGMALEQCLGSGWQQVRDVPTAKQKSDEN